MAEALFICGFHQARPQFAMYLNRGSDDLLSQRS